MSHNASRDSPVKIKLRVDPRIGIAREAEKLSTPRLITLSGAVNGRAAFDGSADIEIVAEANAITNIELEEMLKL